nr:hypothetical protein [Tanacetum cinerariifolium]
NRVARKSTRARSRGTIRIHKLRDQIVEGLQRSGLWNGERLQGVGCRLGGKSGKEINNFTSVFRFNDRVTNLERELSEMKQVDQYAQAISSMPAIVDLSDFATLVIVRNVIKLLEAVVLARSSSPPKSTYEVTASLSKYELTKILLDKMEESKSYLRADYKKEIYDALVKSYNTEKDLFNTYGEWVEDLQLVVESYQKKLNLTKPDTFRSNLRNKTAYTTYSDPQGVIYKDRNNKNRLLRTNELHKFSDGTLNDVRTTLYDIASGIKMEYMPKKKWSGLDKRGARVMIQDIDKQLFQRRLMWNLEKFVGGKEYENDLRLLERTI